MDKIKKVFAIIFLLAVGALFLVRGIGDWRDSRRLISEGKTTLGKVVDEQTHRGRKGRKTYYLFVEFQTEGNQTINRKIEVDAETHTAGTISGSVRVHYLPAAPQICQAGEQVKTKWGMAALGAAFLAGGIFLLRSKQPTDRKELAEAVGDQIKAFCETDIRYVPVEARQFKTLDLAFYDESQRQFESRGFGFLEDVEAIMPKLSKGFERTFLRVMLSRDRRFIACIYHLKPRWHLRAMGAKEVRSYGLDTQFSNHTFVSTDNAEACGALDPTPACSECHLPASTSIAMIIDAHERRVSQHRALHPENEPVAMFGAADVHQALILQQRLKAEYRQQVGLSKAELERLGGVTNHPVINDLHEDLTKNRKAA